jgi:CRP-like cAMP-binding protein
MAGASRCPTNRCTWCRKTRRIAGRRQRELARRIKALAGIELFASLDEAERRKIAERLVHAPFARGDVMTRQGATAHWLYVIASRRGRSLVGSPGGERRLLTRLPPGSIFGEMGLMTGAPRAATVVAASDVECYRLDKASFEDIIHERQTLAESMSQHPRAASARLRRRPGVLPQGAPRARRAPRRHPAAHARVLRFEVAPQVHAARAPSRARPA